MYKKLTAESRGATPLPLGAPGLHAITVHFFSREIIGLRENKKLE